MRYVGDPVAFIVAETLNQAKDAAELIAVEYEILPAVIGAEAALAADAPAVWDDNPGNEAFTHEAGNKAAVERRSPAPRISSGRPSSTASPPTAWSRAAASRSTIGTMTATRSAARSSRCTDRAALAGQIFQLPHHQIRVVCDKMGGGFGMKGGCYPEYALSLWASEVIGRPVRWIAERSEGLQSDEQARGSVVDAELALDTDHKFLGAARPLGVVDRRLLFERPADDPADHRTGLPRQHLRVPSGACRSHRGPDQHDDDRALSRRQPARADLCHRKHHREGGPRARRRSGRIAPPQHDPGEAMPYTRRCARPTTAAISPRTSPTRLTSPAMTGSPSGACRARTRQTARDRGRHDGRGDRRA